MRLDLVTYDGQECTFSGDGFDQAPNFNRDRINDKVNFNSWDSANDNDNWSAPSLRDCSTR